MFDLRWQPSLQIRSWLPRLQSHRGYCQTGLTENTLPAFQKAVELGYKMIEMDVRLTEDVKVILFHDDFINIHGKFQRIQNMKLSELKKLIFVNELQDILSWLQQLNNPEIKLNIELKTTHIFDSSLEQKVIALIQRYSLQKQILISSFNPLALVRIRLIDSLIYRALLLTFDNAPQNKWYIKKMLLNFFCKPHALHLFYENKDQTGIKKINLRVPVVLWTVNGSIGEFDFKNFHGIISDKITPAEFEWNGTGPKDCAQS